MPSPTPVTTTVNRPVLDTYQGNTWITKVNFQNADGSPLDLTGFTLSSELRAYPGAPATSILIDNSAPATGVVTLRLPADVTMSLKAGTYYFDLTRTDAGAESTFVDGTLVIRRSIRGVA